jgi:hypothetical protein
MEDAMLLEAPRSDDFGRLPRLAAKAAPAAICCFFDFAGMVLITPMPAVFATGRSFNDF